jgi:predicted Zn-dependent protease
MAHLASLALQRPQASQGVSIALKATRLAYARGDELEADRLAVRYLTHAGYDPTAMLTFLKKLHTRLMDRSHYLQRGIVRPQYAFTHPYVPERIRAIKEALFDVADYLDYLNTPE